MSRDACIGLAFSALLFIFLSGISARAALVGTASGATLNLTPDTGSFSPNDNFAVSIFLNTHNENVVATAAYLTYDKAHFQATGIDNTSSAFTMEAEKAIDSVNGQIKITFGKPTPGVNSTGAFVAKISFKALSTTAPSSDNFVFSFAPGDSTKSTAIKDDGLGTNILSGVYNGRYSVGSGGPVCGSNGCESSLGETCASCAQDCGACPPLPGDITGGPGGMPDGKVDISDLSLVGSKFGLKSSDIGWSASPDVVANGEIDVYDLVYVASRFS